MPTVYLETSVIGYLASRRSADIVTAGKQQITHDWWNIHRSRFALFVAPPVLDECSAGDPTAAAERLVFVAGITVLVISQAAQELASELMLSVPLPKKAQVDALHIAISATTQMDYLLTWNCKHIANPSLRRRIEEVINAAKLVPPVICSPQELVNV